MAIPSSLQLTGLTITVQILPTLFKDKGLGGYSDFATLRLFVAGDINPQLQQEAYLHEVLHFALWIMGEKELGSNETFVDLLAHLLHQANLANEDWDKLAVVDAELREAKRLLKTLCIIANPQTSEQVSDYDDAQIFLEENQ